MGTQTWIVVGLLAVDLAILGRAYFVLRAYPPMGQRGLVATGAGLMGFVFHAFLFFGGAFLAVQLTCLGGIFALCWLQSTGRLAKPKTGVMEEL